MTDPEKLASPARSILQGPHWYRGPHPEMPPGFYPLRLVLLPGGHSIELTRPDVIIGRHSESDVRLPLPDVSRRHCRFVFLEGRWQVFDLNSLNGTLVNGQLVKQAVLQSRDQVRLGGFTFEVQIQPTHPTVQLPSKSTGDDMLHRIAEALPPENGPPMRRAS